MIINKIKSIRQLNQVSLLLIFNISDIILPSGLFIEMHFNAFQCIATKKLHCFKKHVIKNLSIIYIIASLIYYSFSLNTGQCLIYHQL